MKVITITEYTSLYVGNKGDISDSKYLNLTEIFNEKEEAQKVFNNLKNYVLSNNNKNNEKLDLMQFSPKKEHGDVITAQNYVGIIKLNNNITIEILPKIYSNSNEEELNKIKSRKILLNMLKTAYNLPFKNMQNANLLVEKKMNIFEIYIRLYIDEVNKLIKRGIKSQYNCIESNEKFFKGKLNCSKNIKYNYIHKEKFYVEYDQFNTNRPENKIIKLCLNLLKRVTTSQRNKKDIQILLDFFGEIDDIYDYKDEMDKIILNRNTIDYELIIKLSKIFLEGYSFMPLSGKDESYSLLFPMEQLFEIYVASKIKTIIKKSYSDIYNVTVQDNKKYLFEEPPRTFLLKPDIVVRRKDSSKVFVLDTKWKKLSKDFKNYGISQSDMYQMYAYKNAYDAKKVILLYPEIDENIEIKDYCFTRKHKDDEKIYVHIEFVKLLDDEIEKSKYFENLIKSLEKEE